MAPSHILQIFLRVTVQNQIGMAQRVIVDEIVQLRLLCNRNIQRILDPGAIDGNFSPIPEQQLHAAGAFFAPAIPSCTRYPAVPVCKNVQSQNQPLKTGIEFLCKAGKTAGFEPETAARILSV